MNQERNIENKIENLNYIEDDSTEIWKLKDRVNIN